MKRKIAAHFFCALLTLLALTCGNSPTETSAGPGQQTHPNNTPVGGGFSRALTLTPDSAARADTLPPGGKADFFTFHGDSGKAYEVATQSPGDTRLYLYGSDTDRVMMMSDDNGADLNASVVFYCRVTGSYYVKVMSYAQSDTLSYSISVKTAPPSSAPDSFEYDNTNQTASMISTDNSPQLHTIFPMHDTDFIKFPVRESTYYFVTIINRETSDTLPVTFTSPNHNDARQVIDTLVYAFMGQELGSALVSFNSPGYVYGAQDTHFLGAYQIQVDERNSASDIYEPDGSLATAKSVTDGQSQMRTLSSSTDTDFVALINADSLADTLVIRNFSQDETFYRLLNSTGFSVLSSGVIFGQGLETLAIPGLDTLYLVLLGSGYSTYYGDVAAYRIGRTDGK